jgi:3-oxoacyl-[acyl-carrier protein] reductase
MSALDYISVMQRLTDQVAVVTGAAQGIGRGIASVLGEEGARVVLCDLDAELAESTATTLREQGLDAIALAIDVTDRTSVETMASRVVAEHGRIDILAANAGIYPAVELPAIDDAVWDRVMDVNVKGAVHAVQACMATMVSRGYGRIVLTSSITGPVTGQVGFAPYGA